MPRRHRLDQRSHTRCTRNVPARRDSPAPRVRRQGTFATCSGDRPARLAPQHSPLCTARTLRVGRMPNWRGALADAVVRVGLEARLLPSQRLELPFGRACLAALQIAATVCEGAPLLFDLLAGIDAG